MAVRDDWQHQRLLHSLLMAPRVVLVHGAPDRATSFRRVLPLLGDLDVVTYDRRGYGSAIGDGRDAMTIADHADDLLGVIADGPAVVVGHSFGGHVALAAAIARPGPIASLGVWEPASPWADWWPDPSYAKGVATTAAETDTERLGQRYARQGMGEERWSRLDPTRRAEFAAEGVALRADIADQLTPPYDLDALTTPVVVGCGSPPSPHYGVGVVRMAERIGAELFSAPGAEHLCHIRQPEVFAALVRLAVRRSQDGG